MEECKFGRNVGFLLRDTARLMRRSFNRRVQHLGLTQVQWQALFHISRNEGLTQVALADILEIQPITVARLIDRFEADGLVERRHDPKDRRAFNLHLAIESGPVLDELRSCGQTTRSNALRGFTEKQREEFINSLLLLRENILEDLATTEANPTTSKTTAPKADEKEGK